MSKVSDMIKMYSQQQPSGPRTANTSSVARKWPPVNTSTGASPAMKPSLPAAPKPSMNGSRPSFAPKPSALHPGGNSTAPWRQRNNDNNTTPSWKRPQEDKPTPPWMKNQQDKNEVPAWKRQNEQGNSSVPSWRQKQEEKQSTVPSWRARQEDRPTNDVPSWKARQDQDKNENVPPWKLRQQQERKNSFGNQYNRQTDPPPASNHSTTGDDLPPPPWETGPPPPVPKFAPTQPPPPEEDDDLYLESSSPAHYPPPPPDNFKSPQRTFPPPKPVLEKSSGSFRSTASTQHSDDSEEKAGRRNQSFLHAPAAPPKPLGPKPTRFKPKPDINLPPPLPPSDKPPPKVNGVPPRLNIPPEKYSQPPPIKQSKPPHVVLPSKKGKKKINIPLPSFSRPKSPMRNLPPPPPEDDMPPPLSARDKEPPPLPPMTRNLPIPAGMDTPPSLPPGRRPLPSPAPDKKAMPLPAVPPAACDDVYEDTAEPPPALPPMRQSMPPPQEKPASPELIPTYESDEEDAIYDETADDIPQHIPQPPQMSAGYSPAGYNAAGSFPTEPEEIQEDMYEDVEEYMRLKKLRQPPPLSSPPSEEPKKKQKGQLSKKEKDVRKKFKLTSDGDILPVGQGRVKESMKGGGLLSKGSLAVSTDERVDVIRMTDNPKGKWLVRNNNGEYGYVDSDKVEINTSDLRSMMGGGSHGYGGGASVPAIIPTTEEDEVIYDQTADEDIYEEV